MDKLMRGKRAPLLIVAGVARALSPLVLYWFIHGDSDRYLWIISGPAPISSFGSGPVQLFMHAGLIVMGLALIAAGIFSHRRQRVEDTRLR